MFARSKATPHPKACPAFQRLINQLGAVVLGEDVQVVIRKIVTCLSLSVFVPKEERRVKRKLSLAVTANPESWRTISRQCLNPRLRRRGRDRAMLARGI